MCVCVCVRERERERERSKQLLFYNSEFHDTDRLMSVIQSDDSDVVRCVLFSPANQSHETLDFR